MSRNTTNGSSAQHSSSQRRPVNNQIISNRNQRAQFPYTASVEDDNNFVVPSDWIINTTEELREYWKMIIELHAKFGVFYTLDFQGHRLGDPKGTICQITIKADSINGYDDALLPINTLTKLGNSNMEYIKLHDIDPKDRLRDWLRAERLPFYMPCIISVCRLGEAAFTTEYEGLSLGRIIQEKKYNKLVFAAHRPAVNLAAQYGIRFDSDLNDNDSSNGKKTSPEENNKTSPVEKNEICTEEENKIKLEEKKPPIPGERTWKERMRPRGLIDIQLLEAAVRRCLPQRGTDPRPSDAEPEPLVPPNTDFLSSQAYNNYRLKHLSDIVCSELAGWNSTYDGNVLLGPMGRTRSEHYDPAIQIELLDDSLWLENDTIRVSPLKFKIHSDVASLHHRDRITVFRLVSDEDKKPHTGDNMFCNVSSSSSSTPRSGCDVDLARYSVRNIIYMSHLFCVLNYKMRLRRPQVYETYITLDDVCYHTRKHINRAVRRGNGRDPSFDRTPWDAIWEYFCKARGDLGYAYTTQ
ncbi:hypothetical protein Sste5346_005217 [Sporothrix stenoceras]|uniref:Uncharacterized protein n=1 Tax=Sporothrix stenoceras TaxID=5173 RepID=A0ABR3Z450_9PEZI